MNNEALIRLDAVRQERISRGNAEQASPDRTGATTALVRSAPFQRLIRLISIVALIVVGGALVLAAIATGPVLFGYHTYTIDGGSMEPTLKLGDAAITRPSSTRDLEVGDIIVRRDIQGGQPVLHRIVDITEQDGQRAFVTQGDQNQTPDADPVILVGEGDKVLYRVPYAGYILNFASSWAGRLVLIGLPLVLLSWPFAMGSFGSESRTEQESEGERRPGNDRAPISMLDAGQTEPKVEPVELQRFVERHSGVHARWRQCAEHPPLAGMNTLQILLALRQETGLAATSQRIAEVCAAVGVSYGAERRMQPILRHAA